MDTIWFKNPTILLKNDQLQNIWPLPKMTPEAKVNAVTRLIILLTIVGYLLTLSYKIIYIGIVAIVIICLLYYIQLTQSKKSSKDGREGFINQLPGVDTNLTNPEEYKLNKNKYSKPTVNNPLMNVLLPEIYYDPMRKPAAPTFNATVEREINNSVKEFIGENFHDKNIDSKLFRDLGDKIDFDRSMLSFSGTANTQVPNDQGAFQEYLYGNMISGKQGNPLALQQIETGTNSLIR